MKKILFLAHHRLDRSPGQRYRFEQYFDYFRKHNIEWFKNEIKIGAKGREKVIKKYSKDSAKDLYLNLYKSLMN